MEMTDDVVVEAESSVLRSSNYINLAW